MGTRAKRHVQTQGQCGRWLTALPPSACSEGMFGLFILSTTDADVANRFDNWWPARPSSMGVHPVKHNLICRNNGLYVGWIGPPEYPVLVWHRRDRLIALEGRIYGKTDRELQRDLFGLSDALSWSPEMDTQNISRWLRNIDGDFLLAFVDLTLPSALLVNDTLGRLPCYYTQNERGFAASRDLRMLKNLFGCSFDRMAAAQYLLFGYPLGERTLLNGVNRLPAGTSLAISRRDSRMTVRSVADFNLDHKEPPAKNLKDVVTQLIDLFVDACRVRATIETPNILALSGGLDSRSVAEGLRRIKVPFHAATFQDSRPSTKKDADVATEIARSLGCDLRVHHLPRPRGSDLAQLLELKSGMNSLGMAFMVVFLRRLRSESGASDVRFFTGDGGDKTLQYVLPLGRLSSFDRLLSRLLMEQSITPIERVSQWSGLTVKDICDDLQSLLSDYPEKDWNQKYARFILKERAFKWLFEGEDRNRALLWSVAPFYAAPFFRYAMSRPDCEKQHHRLYREFLTCFSEPLARIRNAAWSLPITSMKARLMQRASNLVLTYSPPGWNKKTLYGMMMRTPRGPGFPDPFFECVRRQLKSCPAIDTVLQVPAIERALDNRRQWTRRQFDSLLTITSVIEKLETGSSSLEDYEAEELVF